LCFRTGKHQISKWRFCLKIILLNIFENHESKTRNFGILEQNIVCKDSYFVVPGGRFNEMYGWDSYLLG
jgi:neutral trehalase